MADEILQEMWKVKDELSEKCRQMGWQEYAIYLNRSVSIEGLNVMDCPRTSKMKAAEESAGYKTK